MDHYSNYLRKAQEAYFSDALHKTFPGAKCQITNTNWEKKDNLPLLIEAKVERDGKHYTATMQYFRSCIPPYDTRYGLFSLDMFNRLNNDDHINLIINPVTLESDYHLSSDEDEERYYFDLAHWAENFESDSYTSPKDGRTVPELIDVIITHYERKKKNQKKNA